MKTIESKIIWLLLCCVIGCSLLIGAVSIASSDKVVKGDASQILTLLCDKYAEQMDALMGRIEQSVDNLARYTQEQLEDVHRLDDAAYMEEYMDSMCSTALNAVYTTNGALTVYIRFDPEISSPVAGLYWGRENGQQELWELPPTDLTLYGPEDDWAKWFYGPMQAGKSLWITPYHNQPLQVLVISYVVPLYKDGVPVGIVGMDIDCAVLEDMVESISVYETGHAFVMSVEDGTNYHPHHGVTEWTQDVPYGLLDAASSGAVESVSDKYPVYSSIWEETPTYLTYRELKNGMYLIVCAPVSEIDSERTALVANIIITIIPAMLAVAMVALFFARRTIAPLKKLSDAAYKVASGTLDVTLPPATEDEVGTLSSAFQEMLMHLKWHNDHMQELAYKDALTGVKNKAAWDEAMGRLTREIGNGSPAFAVVVFDVNDLKQVNDAQGHEAGDELLKNACAAICRHYAHSPVFRIGGDEFAAILERSDYENRADILRRFRAEMSRPDAPVRVASGMAEYQPGMDRQFSDVFRRGDEIMYDNKRDMKTARS